MNSNDLIIPIYVIEYYINRSHNPKTANLSDESSYLNADVMKICHDTKNLMSTIMIEVIMIEERVRWAGVVHSHEGS
jgi:hypothetical protein